MKKRIVLLIAMLLMMLNTVGCSNKVENSEVKEEVKEVVNVGEDKVLKIGMDGCTPGFSVADTNGEVEGYEVDIWNEIAKRNGYTVEYTVMPFSSLFSLVDDGRLDTVANCVAPTEARKEIYNFSDSYLFDELVLLSAPDKNISSLKDLDGWSVTIVAGSTMGSTVDYLEEKEGIKLDRVNFEESGTDDVIMGKVDLTIQSSSTGMNAVESIGADKIKILSGVGLYSENAYPFAKTERGDEIQELANKTLEEMRADGTLSKLSEKWFGMDLTEK